MVADDHAAVRSGAVRLITHGGEFDVVGEAGDGDEAVRVVAKVRPDVVLMDLSMPGLDGVEVIRAITTDHPGAAVVVFTGWLDRDRLARAVGAGAFGHVLKDCSGEDLLGM
ncbi:MAG TPA: response regulator transcription factor, partial [Acidimicrobiales bacterium]